MIQCASCEGMLRSQHLLTDCQGTLIEQLGLLVLVPISVEPCQVVQRGSGIGMLRSQHLLTDCQGTLIERLGLLVPSMEVQVVSCSVEQVCGLWNGDAVLGDEHGAGLRLWEAALALRPCGDLINIPRKCSVDGTHSSFYPLSLFLRGHPIDEHGLDEAMDAEHLRLTIAPQQ